MPDPPSSSTSAPTPAAPVQAAAAPAAPSEAPKQGVWAKVKGFFGGGDKARLAALGMGAFASYSVVSNVTYGACLAIAWYVCMPIATTPSLLCSMAPYGCG